MDILIPAINQATCTKTIDSGDMIVSSGMDAASMKKNHHQYHPNLT